jgi:hypothetical protein
MLSQGPSPRYRPPFCRCGRAVAPGYLADDLTKPAAYREPEIRRHIGAVGIAPSPLGHTQPSVGYPASRRGTPCVLSLQCVEDAVTSPAPNLAPRRLSRREAPTPQLWRGIRAVASRPRRDSRRGLRRERGRPEGLWNCPSTSHSAYERRATYFNISAAAKSPISSPSARRRS